MDLVIFAGLALSAVVWRRGSPAAQYLAVGLVLLMAVAKLYPAVALLAFLPARRRGSRPRPAALWRSSPRTRRSPARTSRRSPPSRPRASTTPTGRASCSVASTTGWPVTPGRAAARSRRLWSCWRSWPSAWCWWCCGGAGRSVRAGGAAAAGGDRGAARLPHGCAGLPRHVRRGQQLRLPAGLPAAGDTRPAPVAGREGAERGVTLPSRHPRRGPAHALWIGALSEQLLLWDEVVSWALVGLLAVLLARSVPPVPAFRAPQAARGPTPP